MQTFGPEQQLLRDQSSQAPHALSGQGHELMVALWVDCGLQTRQPPRSIQVLDWCAKGKAAAVLNVTCKSRCCPTECHG